MPQADGDEPAGDWATFHDSVHDVPANKKSNAMLVFILFSTEENLVLSLLLFHQSSDISFPRLQGCSICACPFRVLAPEVSPQVLVSLCSMCLWWCCLFHESLISTRSIFDTSFLVYGGRRGPCWPGRRPIRYSMVACFYHMVSPGQSTTWRSPSLSRLNTSPLSSSWNPSAHLASSSNYEDIRPVMPRWHQLFHP